jgi:hypothetical protein
MEFICKRRRNPLEFIRGGREFFFREESRPVSNGPLLPRSACRLPRFAWDGAGERDGWRRAPVEEWRPFMLDVVMLVIGVGAFALLIGNVALCERL